MKKYIIFIASAVLMMTACAKEEINTATGETEFISVEFAATKTALDVDGKNTNWTEGDKVSVTVNGENLGELAFVGDNKFEGDIKSVGLDGKLQATINYPAGETTVPATQAAVAGSFADEAALLEGTVTLANLRAGKGGELANKTALLQFTVAEAGDVTFEVGSTKYTVTGCKTGSTYYACVAPATAKLTARIGGYLLKATSAAKTFEAGKIAKLNQLPAREKFGWGLVGEHQGWTISNPTSMYKVADKVYAVLNVSLKADGFKFAKTGLQNWNTANTYFGAWTKSSGNNYFNFSTEMGTGAWYSVYTNNLGGQSENIGVSDFSKKYDVYVKVVTDADWGQELQYIVVTAGTTVSY